MRTKILSALVIGALVATGATTAQAATSACTYKPATWLPVPAGRRPGRHHHRGGRTGAYTPERSS